MNSKIWWFSIVRIAVLAAVLWGLLRALGGVLRIAPGWPPAAVACGIALAAELLLLLYRYESRNLGQRRSRQLMGLRLAALALLSWILIEPTFVRTVKRELDTITARIQAARAAGVAVDEGWLLRQGVLDRLPIGAVLALVGVAGDEVGLVGLEKCQQGLSVGH